jgi:hypothetical protein
MTFLSHSSLAKNLVFGDISHNLLLSEMMEHVGEVKYSPLLLRPPLRPFFLLPS